MMRAIAVDLPPGPPPEAAELPIGRKDQTQERQARTLTHFPPRKFWPQRLERCRCEAG
jgi:hypothetical protein